MYSLRWSPRLNSGIMRTLLTVLGLFLVLAAAAPPLSYAQGRNRNEDTGTRSVQGAVTDPAGAPVDGAIVHLKNTKTLQIRSYITKTNGTYTFHGLSTNVDYELKAEHQGAASDVKTLSVFDSRKNATINLKLNKK